jgi:dolichyl-phosphate-mannose--protein O-mannosyl transferase
LRLNTAAQVMTIAAAALALLSNEARALYAFQVQLPVWLVLMVAIGLWVAVSWLLTAARRGPTGAGPQIEHRPIRIGDTIRLLHQLTGCALHAHNTEYSHPGSSKQHQVTASGGQDSNDYWVVRAQQGMGDETRRGRRVRNGDIIRLTHQNTRRNLHSHAGVSSPVSGQQEVTAFGGDGVGDTNDNWRFDIPGGGTWTEDVPVRLIHVLSGAALHSHRGIEHPLYTSGQQEVTGFTQRDENDLWIAARSDTV